MGEPSRVDYPNTTDWLRLASQRDAVLIEAVIARLEARGFDTTEWRRLLLKAKRQSHEPYWAE